MRLKLRSAGIRTAARFLEEAQSAKGRLALAEKTEIDPKVLLHWANLIDRMRVKGIGQDYAELLEVVGVVTVNQLKYRSPANLAKAMKKANDQRKLVNVLPSALMVGRWIENARKLPLKISY
jgi:hypothetical protein